ncbi:MAG: NUDIX hydrolase [Propionibacteriaceae bacterium]
MDGIVRVAQALAEGTVGAEIHASRPGGSGRRSAVLALLTADEEILLLKRSSGMRQHSGQMAFPGGGEEAGETPTETALRETWEELGIDPASVRVLGQLPSINIPASGFDVVTVVGWWRDPGPLTINPGEVASASLVPLAELADPACRFCAVAGEFRTPGFDVSGQMCWGFTALILDELVRVGGWEQPWNHEDQRTVAS